MSAARGLIVLLFACTCWRENEATETTVVGVVGKSITLKCDIQHADPPVVSWVDLVYNSGHDAQPIFSTETGMDDSHANRQNLSVNVDDFSLTISSLKLELGAGNYICRSQVDGTTIERTYNLVVRGMPQCRGDSQLVSGEPTKLVCEVQLAGTFESALSWTRNGADVQSNDGSDIGKALLSVNLNKAGPDDDKAVYQCEMRIADVVEDSCSITLDVAYGAMDVKFSPNTASLSVGDELRCTARGNPTPEITLSPANLVKESKSGANWRSLAVQPDWVGRTLTVECTAANSVDGVQYSPSHSVTFNVTEKASTQKSTSGNYTAIIAIVAILVMIAAAAVVIIIICFIQRRRSKKPPKGSKPIPTKDDSAPEHRGTNGQTATA